MFVHRPLTVQSSFVVHLHQHQHPSTSFIHFIHPSTPINHKQPFVQHPPINHQPSASNPPATWCAKEHASEWATRVTRNGTVTTVLAYHLPLPPSYIPKPHASTIPVSYTHIHHPILESIKQLHSIITNVKHHKPSSINQQPSFVQHSPINYQPSFISIQFTRNLVCKRDAQQIQLLAARKTRSLMFTYLFFYRSKLYPRHTPLSPYQYHHSSIINPPAACAKETGNKYNC